MLWVSTQAAVNCHCCWGKREDKLWLILVCEVAVKLEIWQWVAVPTITPSMIMRGGDCTPVTPTIGLQCVDCNRLVSR